MSAPPVRIRIGAELDSSLARSLATAQQMIGRAEKQAQREKKATTTAGDQAARQQIRAHEQLTKATESLDRQRARSLYAQFKEQENGAERAAKAQERSMARAQAAERREIEKTVRMAQKGFDQEARAQSRSTDRFARRTSHRATRFLMPEAPIGSMVMRGVSAMTGGLGVDLGLESNIRKVADFETQMIGLRNQARVAGKPMRETGGGEIKATADMMGFTRSSTAEAVGAFATKTGDVNLGLDSMSGLAKRAAAANTSLEDMMDAAADVANGLGDIPNKSQKMLETIDGFIVQGGRGAVEIKDMATKMPKFAASAGRFEGDASTNMLKLGALGQLARSSGGATSAAEAATSVARFADTFGTNARAKQFKAHGIEIFGANNQIRDPMQLIRESLIATKGNQLEMGKLFASSLGVRSTRGLSTAFNKAGGGDAGMKAVNDMFDGFMKDLVLSDETLKTNLAERDASMQVRAQKFNNKLEDITSAMASKTLPALEKLEGPLLRAADALSGLVQSAVDHPWAAVAIAISGAITAAIARAAIESAFRAGLEKVLAGTPLPFGGAGAGVVAGGRMGAGLRLLGNGLIGGALGGAAGGLIGGQFGDAGMGATIGAGAGAGGMMFGWTGAAAGAATGAAIDQNQKLKQENAGMGIGDLLWGSLTTGKGFFEQVDAENNRKAKEEAAIRATLSGAPGGAAGQSGVQPLMQQMQTDNAALTREAQQSRQVQQQMLEQLTVIAGKQAPPGTPPGQVTN